MVITYKMSDEQNRRKQDGTGEIESGIYARVSTAEEEQLKALPKQVEECKDVIASKGWKLVDGYVDEEEWN